MTVLLWALVAVPLTAGALLAGAGRRGDRFAPVAATAVAAVDTVLAVVAAFRHPHTAVPFLEGAPFGLAVDGLSGLLVVTVAAVTTAVLLFAVGDIGPDEARSRFFGLMLLFSGAMLVTVTATTLPALLMGWEVMGATSWALIGYWWREPVRMRAAYTALITTRAADLGLYLAFGAAVAAGGGTALDGLADAPSRWLHVAAGGVIAAALGKSAQLPFSFWLSKAMQGPSPVSALLHSATMVVAGAYLLIRVQPLLGATGWADDAVAWTGVATAVLLGLVAVAQTELKQLLAASSCAQIGFMVLAAGVGSTTGGTLQLIAHAAAKSLAFLAAGLWLTTLGTQNLARLRGAARRQYAAGAAFTVAALSLAGVPPLSLWVAKDTVLTAALEKEPALYAAGLAAAVVSAVYAVKALWYVWQPAPRESAPREPAPQEPVSQESASQESVRLPLAVAVPFTVLAVACAALSAVALRPVHAAFARTLDAVGEPAAAGWEYALSGALAVATSGAVWVWADRHRRARAASPAVLRDWLGLEAAAHAVVVAPVRGMAALAARFDDRVLDRGTEVLARGTARLADAVNRSLETTIDGSVGGIAAACRALGRLARRPQTGQLHQYLAQAVAAFALLAVVFVLVR
ncbi:NADH-quinone oxidoreductase subunit L [Uniformispora flossi]|uniref:NADH-quinone oxidoreductase subunit 5 family protein n=1 Tax=Uniformispora flossi TaxID=3390723 RepID=UPI003C2E3A1B